jgi:hypothetical protein
VRLVELTLELLGAVAVLGRFGGRHLDASLELGCRGGGELRLLRELVLEPAGLLACASAFGLCRGKQGLESSRTLGMDALRLGGSRVRRIQVACEPLGSVTVLVRFYPRELGERLQVRGDRGGLLRVTRQLRLEFVDTFTGSGLSLGRAPAQRLGLRDGPVGPLALLERLCVRHLDERL